MDTNHEAVSADRAEKRSQKFLHYKLQPGDAALLEQLPKRQAELILAEGSYQDMANRFNLPIGTVRSRLHRARAALEKLRDGHAENDNPNPPPLRHLS